MLDERQPVSMDECCSSGGGAAEAVAARSSIPPPTRRLSTTERKAEAKTDAKEAGKGAAPKTGFGANITSAPNPKKRKKKKR